MHIGVIGYMILFPLVKIYKSIFVPLVQSGMVVLPRGRSLTYLPCHILLSNSSIWCKGKKQTHTILSPQSVLEKYGPSCEKSWVHFPKRMFVAIVQ